MRGVMFSGAVTRPYDAVHPRLGSAFPLLELDDAQVVAEFSILAGDQEIDSLGSLRDLVLDADAAIARNGVMIYDLGDGDQRFTPGPKLAKSDVPPRPLVELAANDVLDVGRERVFQEPGLVILVDDHPRCQSSVYFLLTPKLLSTGYFSALTLSFSFAADLRSTRRQSAREIR